MILTSVADPDPFGTDPDPAFHFDTDLYPYRFKKVMYLKQYQFFLYIFTSVGGLTGPTQKIFFVQFSLPVNFVRLMRVAYGPGSRSSTPGGKLYGSGSTTLILTTPHLKQNNLALAA